MYTLEPQGKAHRRAVVDIFNIHVAQGRGTFFEEPVSAAFFDLLLRAVGDHPAQPCGQFARIGVKQGNDLDLIRMQKML